MKLQAAILFAVTNAQRDGGRVRDKEVNSADVSDAFADYFGDANNAFGDYNAGDSAAYDAFGDSYEAFGDLSFGDYAADYSSGKFNFVTGVNARFIKVEWNKCFVPFWLFFILTK